MHFISFSISTALQAPPNPYLCQSRRFNWGKPLLEGSQTSRKFLLETLADFSPSALTNLSALLCCEKLALEAFLLLQNVCIYMCLIHACYTMIYSKTCELSKLTVPVVFRLFAGFMWMLPNIKITAVSIHLLLRSHLFWDL